MLFEEQAPPSVRHPETEARGSQSCASLTLHADLQDVAAFPLLAEAQQTVSPGQFAAPLHCIAMVPALATTGHAFPTTHEYEKLGGPLFNS